MKKKIIIVGNGMVSYKFCERFTESEHAGDFEVVVYGEELYPSYDRVHLTEYYTGKSAEELTLGSKQWYAEKGISLNTGEMVTGVNIDTKSVSTIKESGIKYDILIFATGSAPFVPQIDGIEKKGVFVYRTFDDIDAIKAYIPNAKKAAVIGGGLLGLEAAKALLDDGLDTSIVEFAPRLMPRQLDDNGAAILRNQLEKGFNLNVLLGKSTKLISGNGKVDGMEFNDDTKIDVDMVVVSAGIKPRDEVARKAGIAIGERGGIIVNEYMQTSVPDVYAIGECALAMGMIWGLVAPCYDMVDVVISHITGGDATFKGADMSTKLKLIGTDVASFGDAFCEKQEHVPIVYNNKISGVYKRINVSPDGKILLGGILVGEAEEYNTLLQLYKNRMALPSNPEVLILPNSGGGFQLSLIDLPDTAGICSCENVSKGKIVACVNNGATTIPQIKKACKAGTGCGGCVPIIDDLVAEIYKSQGKVLKKTICEHYDHTRQELYHIIKTTGIKTFDELLHKHGKGDGCEICKPVAASLFASIWNEPVPKQATIQDTNDRFLANIQRGGTYSVVPRIPAGEITPEKLIVIGQVARKYDLYTKITGGQRVDMFGAKVHELPQIWEELIDAGFETGQAYGKSLRTVKSCVGTTWCRFGVQDSVSFAIRVENRYKGLRAPHKIKGGVSGCIRECAEARGKDFGIIATEKGWNLFVCGNGGATPKHAELLVSDIDDETVIKYLDRFLMFYIRTAEPLTRTAKWLNKLEGGLDYLRDVVVNDCLGIDDELEKDMQYMVDTYECEWKVVVENPELRSKFRHFANSDEVDGNIEFVPLRDQKMPAPW